jgi:hypothetical protein
VGKAVLRISWKKKMNSHPCHNTGHDAAALLRHLLAEEDAGFSALGVGFSVHDHLRDDVVVVGLHPVGDQGTVGVVPLGAGFEGHSAAEGEGASRRLCCRCRWRGRLGFLGVGLTVERVPVADDGAVAAGVGVLLNLIAAVALDGHDLRGVDLHNNAGMIGSAGTAGIAEENLVAHLRGLVAAALLLVVLHAVGAACTQHSGLALNTLAFVFAVCLEEYPVHKNVAPCVGQCQLIVGKNNLLSPLINE